MDPSPLRLYGPVFYSQSPPVVHVRQRLKIYGTIIPVMYDTEDHSHVVFRAGERLFIYRTEFRWNDAEDNDQPELGVLPRTYSQFLSMSEDARIAMLSDYEIRWNLQHWYPPAAFLVQDKLGRQYAKALTYIERASGNRERAEKILETWRDEQWEVFFREKSYEI